MSILLQPCALSMSLASEHCPACPVTEIPECESTIRPDCVLADPYSAEPRSTQFKPEYVPLDLPVAIESTFYETASNNAATAYSSPVTRSGFYPGGPPLNVLYCVYLN
jgi:hypothetical protein